MGKTISAMLPVWEVERFGDDLDMAGHCRRSMWLTYGAPTAVSPTLPTHSSSVLPAHIYSLTWELLKVFFLTEPDFVRGPIYKANLTELMEELLQLVPCWERPHPLLPVPSKNLKTERAFYVSDKWFGKHFVFGSIAYLTCLPLILSPPPKHVVSPGNRT